MRLPVVSVQENEPGQRLLGVLLGRDEDDEWYFAVCLWRWAIGLGGKL